MACSTTTTELDALHKAQVGNLAVTAVYPTVITGGTTALTVNVTNSAPSQSDTLNFTASASGTGYGLSTTGSLAATNSGNFTIANGFNSTSLSPGSYTGTVTVTGTNSALGGLALGSGATQTVTVNVYDHSNASLSSTANQTSRNDQLRQRAARGDHPQPEFHDLQPGGEHVGSLHGELETDRLHGQRRSGPDHELSHLQRPVRRAAATPTPPR